MESLSISLRKRQFLLFSPLLIILVGFTTATLFSRFIQEWAWVPLALVYWTAMGVFVFIGKGDKQLKDWIRKPESSKLTILGLILGMIPLTVLFTNLKLFDSFGLVVLWLSFAFVNPVFEEYYWRGLLLDTAKSVMPTWLGIAYSTILFVASHPLMWGVFSIANRSYHVFIYLSIIGIVWSLMYIRTKSLRWVILSHFIVDIGIITVLVFLNIYVPPTM